jgi:hypothetical protein
MDRHPFADDLLAREADRLLASTVLLMARFAANPCPELARVIERHAEAVSRHAGCGELVRAVCREEGGTWGARKIECPLGYGAPPCGHRA